MWRGNRLRVLSVAGVAVVAAATLTAGTAAGGENPRFAVPGLSAPVRMVVDTWGVPHIYARTVGDLFQAQGFNAARDRLFQIDTWRRRGLGELSSVLGPRYVAQDRAARLFLYRGDMAREWASYSPDAKAAATRFAAGVNAYVDWLAIHPAAMPPEFTKFGYSPAHWSPQDVVRIRSHAIGNNLSAELGRAKLACLAGIGASRYYTKLEPAHTPKVPAGLDPCSVPDDVAAVYTLATQAVTFPDGSGGGNKALSDAASGSNSWAVSGSRTATGRPVLASDPHREDVYLPTDRYIAQLSAPGMDVIGAGEPWNPGISIGHNGSIAFGLTNLPADQTDLYVYDLDPKDPTRYRYNGHWEPMRTVTERVPVRGGTPQAVQLQFTRHGPVVKVDAAHHRAYAVRTVWTEPGTSPYLASLSFQRATDFRQFDTAMRRWRTPGSNLVYADTHGDIGWVPGALVPRRTGADYDGLLPVPGDGRYEWRGFYQSGQLPTVHNPARGYFASANDANFPPGYPIVPSYEWAPPYRQQRISALLAGQPRHTVADTMAIQNDEKSAVATDLLPFAAALRSTDPDTGSALAMLRGFDGVVSKDSTAATVFETWIMSVLYPAWAHTLLPGDAADALVKSNINPDFRQVADSFAHPGDWFPGGAPQRDKLILDTLATTWRTVRGQLGPDPAKWQWGAAHIHLFLSSTGGKNVGPIPVGGSFHTVHPSYYDYQHFPHIEVLGATFKMGVDVGGWDNSRAINAPGQSGDERSPHYADLLDTYGAGKSFPLLYSERAVAEHAQTTIELDPA